MRISARHRAASTSTRLVTAAIAAISFMAMATGVSANEHSGDAETHDTDVIRGPALEKNCGSLDEILAVSRGKNRYVWSNIINGNCHTCCITCTIINYFTPSSF